MFLDVLDEEGRSSEVVDGDVEEALDLLLVKVHGDDVSHSRSDQHLSQEFANDGSALPHLVGGRRGGGGGKEGERGKGKRIGGGGAGKGRGNGDEMKSLLVITCMSYQL